MKSIQTQPGYSRLLRGVFSITTLLCIATFALTLVEGRRESQHPIAFWVAITLIWIYYLIQTTRNPTGKHVQDISYGVFAVLMVWETGTRILDRVPKVLFPSPEDVFAVFHRDTRLMLAGLWSSLFLLIVGFAIALTAGNLLGLVVGWNLRLRNDFFPIAKVLSPIPPMIYTPYLIAIMPTFTAASITVLALGLFWPTFMNMINRVASMDRRIIDSAKVMAVSTPTMLLKVLLPYSIPGIISGLRVQLSTTFMVLIMAEMVGAQSGLGFYVKKYSDYADYTRVVAGIIFIGFVITILNFLLTLFEKHVVKWRVA